MKAKRSAEELISRADALHCAVASAQRELFSVIAEMDRLGAWEGEGARDMAHWLWMRYGLSYWKAHRWIASAHALESLPLIAGAFASGELSIDKVVELTRFATPETEQKLIPWAQRVSCGAIRNRGDLAARRSVEDVRQVEDGRSLGWWYFDDGKRFGLEAELPAAQGAVVAKALERLAQSLPVMPGEEDPYYAQARRADALVALCSARLAEDADADRATVIIHAPLEAVASGGPGGALEGDGVAHPETVRRLLCHARVQMVVEDERGEALRLGRMSREPSASMLRQLRYRDRECTFPGCGSRRFTQAHHVQWWRHGGRTDLDNLVLICAFHHRLVHEHGWSLRRESDGTVAWFRPDGTRYRAGPAPPAGERNESVPAIRAAGY